MIKAELDIEKELSFVEYELEWVEDDDEYRALNNYKQQLLGQLEAERRSNATAAETSGINSL